MIITTQTGQAAIDAGEAELEGTTIDDKGQTYFVVRNYKWHRVDHVLQCDDEPDLHPAN